MRVRRHLLPILTLGCAGLAGGGLAAEPSSGETGVFLNELGLERHVFVEDERLQRMTDIHVDRGNRANEAEVWLAAKNAILIADHKGEIRDAITPHHPPPRWGYFRSHIVDVDSDSEMEIYRYQFGLGGPIYLLNRRGEIRWQADVIHGETFAFGDLTGDGVDELILSSLKAIQVFDEKRGKLFTLDIPDSVHSVVTFDVDDTPGEELFAFVNDGDFSRIIIDFNQKKATFESSPSRNTALKGESSKFLISLSKTRSDRCTKSQCILFSIDNKYKLYDPYRNMIVASFSGPYIIGFRGVEVRFSEDSAPYFAVAGLIHGDMNRFEIYVRFLIFNSEGELVYEEVFESRAEGIAVLPRSDGGEDLLVGGDGFAVRYTLPATRKAE